MKTTQTLTFMRLCTAIGLAVTLSSALAQAVFKCTVAGQTVYQAAPCAGQGKQLDLPPGPSAQEVQDAKRRAGAEIARASRVEFLGVCAAERGVGVAAGCGAG